MIDLHTHSTFSHDGQSSPSDLADKAIELGLKYLGFSEHLDLDDLYTTKLFKQLDISDYFSSVNALKEKYKDRITLLVGLEFGFIKNRSIQYEYAAIYEKYRPDFVINSLHVSKVRGGYFDYYRMTYGKKKKVFENYLKNVYDSTNSLFHYDIIGHLCYATRYAPYDDKRINYLEFKKSLDRVLKNIISQGKILEVNGGSRVSYSSFLPDSEILQAYYDLGGRKVCYGSDAHSLENLGRNYKEIAHCLKTIGFDCLTIPIKNKHIEIEI